MLKGFREFLVRGNIVDLAVAVVIGTALVALVTAFSTSVINPLLAAFGPADSLGLGYQLRDGSPNTFVDVGSFISAVITFVITAAVVYLAVVVPMTKVTARFTRADGTTEPIPPDVELLTEIRDLLRQQRGGGVPGSGTTGSAPTGTGSAPTSSAPTSSAPTGGTGG